MSNSQHNWSQIWTEAQNPFIRNFWFADKLLRRTVISYNKIKKNEMQSYIRFKFSYDKKAKVLPLQENDYCFILQHKTEHKGSKAPFRNLRWIGLYMVKRKTPNENYKVRKKKIRQNSNFTSYHISQFHYGYVLGRHLRLWKKPTWWWFCHSSGWFVQNSLGSRI